MGHPATPDKIMQLGMAYWGSKTLLGLLNISGPCPIDAPGKPACVSGRECSKKHALSLSEGSIQQGRSHFDERSVLIVREHGKRAKPACAKATAGRERRWLVCRSLGEGWRLFSTFPIWDTTERPNQ